MFKVKKNPLIYAAIGVSLLLLLFSLIPAVRPNLFNSLELPLHLVRLFRREIAGIVFYHRNFIQKELLRREIDFLKQKLNTMEEVSLENKRLKGLLAFKQKAAYKVIAAEVIGRSPDNWSSLIIIDKGRHNGIKRGFVAINYLGLIGRVMEVTESTSKIMLINDPNISVSAIVQRSRQEGLASGTLGNFLIMKYLPKNSDVKVSDIVISSGLTGIYPKGLLIGTVIDIGEEFSGLSRYAVIQPAVALSNIEEVLVIVQ